MIIKSMGRKQGKLSQLLAYIDHSACDSQPFYWNILATPQKVTPKFFFKKQLKQLNTRQNGNQIYHEILSLKKGALPPPELQNVLYYLLIRYLQERAPHMVAYARCHEEPHHMHVHVVISANALGQSRPHRLSKARFKDIRLTLQKELYQLYPVLDPDYDPLHEYDY